MSRGRQNIEFEAYSVRRLLGISMVVRGFANLRAALRVPAPETTAILRDSGEPM